MSEHAIIYYAADRLAIRELIEAYAHCADRRDAKRQMSLEQHIRAKVWPPVTQARLVHSRSPRDLAQMARPCTLQLSNRQQTSRLRLG